MNSAHLVAEEKGEKTTAATKQQVFFLTCLDRLSQIFFQS